MNMFALALPLALGIAALGSGLGLGKAVSGAMEAMESVEVSHVVRRAELSYEPENPRLKPEEVKYVHYGFYYALPGKETELEAIAKGFADLYAEKGIDSGWSIYQRITGPEMPLYVVAHAAKSEADYYANRERIREQLGEEAKKLGAKVGATVRRMEFKEGHLRPDLSFPEQYPQPQATKEPHTHSHEGHEHHEH